MSRSMTLLPANFRQWVVLAVVSTAKRTQSIARPHRLLCGSGASFRHPSTHRGHTAVPSPFTNRATIPGRPHHSLASQAQGPKSSLLPPATLAPPSILRAPSLPPSSPIIPSSTGPITQMCHSLPEQLRSPRRSFQSPFPTSTSTPPPNRPRLVTTISKPSFVHPALTVPDRLGFRPTAQVLTLPCAHTGPSLLAVSALATLFSTVEGRRRSRELCWTLNPSDKELTHVAPYPSVISIPDNRALTLSYNDPVTNSTQKCTEDCPLLTNPAVPYQDFVFDAGAQTLTGFQLTLTQYKGASAGLHLLQLLSDGAKNLSFRPVSGN